MIKKQTARPAIVRLRAQWEMGSNVLRYLCGLARIPGNSGLRLSGPMRKPTIFGERLNFPHGEDAQIAQVLPEGPQFGAAKPPDPEGIPFGRQLEADISLVTLFPLHLGHSTLSSDADNTSISKSESHVSQ